MYIYNCSKLSQPHYGNHLRQVKVELMAGLRVERLVRNLKLVSTRHNTSSSAVHDIKIYIFIIPCVSLESYQFANGSSQPLCQHPVSRLKASRLKPSWMVRTHRPLISFHHSISTNCRLLSQGQAQSLTLYIFHANVLWYCSFPLYLFGTSFLKLCWRWCQEGWHRHCSPDIVKVLVIVPVITILMPMKYVTDLVTFPSDGV